MIRATVIVLAPWVGTAHAEGLQTEVMLHPGDAFTGYTLKQGEVVYHQAVLSLPLPSWVDLGVTDWMSVNIDAVAILGGLAIEPHRPIPSIDLRMRLHEPHGRGIAVSLETCFLRPWQEFDDQLSPQNPVYLARQGINAFARVNASQPLTDTLQVHGSLGVGYVEDLLIQNQNRDVVVGRRATRELNPDASLGLDWRPRPWLGLFATGSYGNTFVYIDHVPRKLQLAYAVRIAPFYTSRLAILRTLRVESTAFFQYYRDAKEWVSLPVPIFPVVYWQWRW